VILRYSLKQLLVLILVWNSTRWSWNY